MLIMECHNSHKHSQSTLTNFYDAILIQLHDGVMLSWYSEKITPYKSGRLILYLVFVCFRLYCQMPTIVKMESFTVDSGDQVNGQMCTLMIISPAMRQDQWGASLITIRGKCGYPLLRRLMLSKLCAKLFGCADVSFKRASIQILSFLAVLNRHVGFNQSQWQCPHHFYESDWSWLFQRVRFYF